MLRRLFKRKPRLEAAEAEDRIAALSDLAADDQPAIAGLFREDPDPGVRLAALARLTDPAALAAGLEDPALKGQVAQRILAVVGDDENAALGRHPLVQHTALAGAETAETAVRAARRIADASARATALAANPTAQVRQAVVEATWEPDALVEIEKVARGHDKSVLRLARDRLAEFKAASMDRDRQDADIDKLLATAAALRDDDPHYDARRDAIERDWAGLLDAVRATDGLLARFGVVTRDVDASRRRFPARRVVARAVEVDTGAAFDPLLAEATALRDAVADALAGGVSTAAVAALKDSASALAAKWNATADAQPPSEEMSAQFRIVMAAHAGRLDVAARCLELADDAASLLEHGIPDTEAPDGKPVYALRNSIDRQHEAVDALVARYDWPDDLPVPPVLDALRERQQDLQRAAAQCDALVVGIADEVAAALAALRDSVERGAVHEAVERDRALRDLVNRLPRTQAQSFSADLQDIGGRVRELRDWRAYAVRPKREALCRQIEELADTPLDVHAQAEAVRTLRAQWNELGSGDTRRDRELKKQFDRSAERAFEPCRIYFKEQAARRSFNLEQRKAIVSALEDYVANNDWDHADWRGVEKVLRQARAEWRHYHPVDRKVARELAARFETLASDIHGRLKEQWDLNIEAKEEIVAAATEVQESGDPATAKADAIKALQRRWKEVGPLPRRADQRLWKLFRAQCDAVFDARNEVRDRHSQRQRAVDDANALINELERRVDIDPSLDRNTIADYERRLHELGSLPNDVQRRADAMLQHADRVAVERQNRRAE